MVELDYLDELKSKADAFRVNASQKGSPDCKCCLNSSTVFIGDVDFSKSCADGRITDRVFEVSSVFVPYYQCSFCGLCSRILRMIGLTMTSAPSCTMMDIA